MVVELAVIDGCKELYYCEEEFERQNFILQELLSFSSDWIFILNHKKQILYYSKSFTKIFFNSENISGISFFTIMKQITRLPDDFFAQTHYFLKINSTNKEFIVKSELSQYQNKFKKSKRYIIILKDLSTQEELKEERDNFISALTHDLKTPVRANILSLELLLKGSFGKLTEKQEIFLQEILNSNLFTINMLDTLLAKYKYENKCTTLNKTYFCFKDLLQQSVESLKPLLYEKNITCKLCLYSHNKKILADRTELKRAIDNILTNAIKFNTNNGYIKISAEQNSKNIIIKIQDRGVGICNEKLNHIFDKYVSYENHFRQIGTGLGLYVAKTIIEAHGGKIKVKSKEHYGSNFIIELPV